MSDTLMQDMENMEEAMCRTADRCDIWQDRLIYAMAKAIYDLLNYVLRKEKRRDTLEKADQS